MTVDYKRRRYKISQSPPKTEVTVFQRNDGKYTKIYKHNPGRILSSGELYHLGVRIVDALETMEKELTE